MFFFWVYNISVRNVAQDFPKNKEVYMLKLTLKPGDFIDIGEDIRVVFSGGSANNIHLLVDAPRELNIARSSAGGKNEKTPYYKEQGISDDAKRQIREILMRERAEKR